MCVFLLPMKCCPQLDVYVEHRLNKFLELLLKYMHDIVGKHSDADVLRNCAFTYRYFINNELSIQTTAAVAFRQLIDELVSSFHSLITDGTQSICQGGGGRGRCNSFDDRTGPSHADVVMIQWIKSIFSLPAYFII